MFAKERQEQIVRLLEQRGAVTTSGLVKEFGVSVETVRRDLLEMERSGLLNRVHGGAVAVGGMKKIHTLSERNREFEAEKRRLAQTAAALVENGDMIGIDTGSTAIFFAEALKERLQRLTVVTHSLDVFRTLCHVPEFTVILCGGHYMQEENTFCGALVLDTMKKLRMEKVFIFPSAVSLRYGICDYSQELYLVQQQMLVSGEKVYILADSSKFEKRAMLCLAEMNPEFCYVTDSGLSTELRRVYQENQIQVICE